MIIGSTAIKHWFPDFPREPKDLDIVVRSKKGLPKINGVEYLENPVLLDWCEENDMLGEYCPWQVLYTLKVSHSFWSLDNGSWEKHVWDIQWLRNKYCMVLEDLFWRLYEYWEKVHGKRKTSNLDLSAEDFFNNSVGYPVPHDDLHYMLIQHPYFKEQKKPTFTYILKDGAEVDVDMIKFLGLMSEQKFNVVFEEIAVMALERYRHLYYKAAYNKMLKKFVISHCKIEEGIWIIENHKELTTNIPFNFIEYLKPVSI